MILKKNAPVPPWHIILLLLIISAVPLWEAWTVISRFTMASVHCNGMFAGSFCSLGLWVGRNIFGVDRAYLGYFLVSSGAGLFFLYSAAKCAYRRWQAARNSGHV